MFSEDKWPLGWPKVSLPVLDTFLLILLSGPVRMVSLVLKVPFTALLELTLPSAATLSRLTTVHVSMLVRVMLRFSNDDLWLLLIFRDHDFRDQR